MDLTITPITITAAPTAGKPPPESESETPPAKLHPTKPTSFNGVLKCHAPRAVTVAVTYKECLKNHAASMGGHALDGCGEFMPAPTATAADPTSLKCAACGCHRNFHRREPEDFPPAVVSPIIEYHPHQRHHPPPPPSGSQSPPPISSAYYPGSAPHMLLALSEPNRHGSGNTTRKRFRTKFTQQQKDKMHEFAEKVGWKMQKNNEDLVKRLCSDIGVERGVFKVWMHNNKNTFAKRPANSERNGNRNGDGGNSHSSSIEQQDLHHHHDQYNGKSNESNAPTNASSSSS